MIENIDKNNELKNDIEKTRKQYAMDFSVFYKWGNDKLEYWIAMVKLLERAGHKQIDIQSAFMDLIVKTGPIDKSIPKNEVQKEVLALMNQAVEKVFGIKD